MDGRRRRNAGFFAPTDRDVKKDLLHIRAGTYSPPIPKTTRMRLSGSKVEKRGSRETSKKVNSEGIHVTKDLLKNFLGKCSPQEIKDSLTSLLKTEYLSPTTIDWVITWSDKNSDSLGLACITAVGCLCFPDEKIPGLKDILFLNVSLVKSILFVLMEHKIQLSREIQMDEIIIEDKIGSGAGGFVFHAKYKNKDVALKRFKLEGEWLSDEKEFYYEAAFITIFGSFKNFIHCFGMNYQEGFIVMPLANKTLEDLINDGNLNNHGWTNCYRIAYQIAEAMCTLHRYGIVHRDLKPANILLDQQYNCYLSDFGVSNVTKEFTGNSSRKRYMTMNVGTNVFMAPEVADGDGFYKDEVDVFSYAVILWQLVTECTHPYIDQGLKLFEIPEFIASGKRLEIPPDCPQPLSKLISKCWHSNPKKRPSFKQISLKLNDLMNQNVK